MKRLLAILILILLLGGTAFWLLRKPAALPVAALPELLALVPQDSVAVAYVDFAALRKSPFWQKSSAQFPAPERDTEFSRFVEETGFDHERDLDRAAVAWQLAGKDDTRTVAIADGRFDHQKIRAYAERTGKIESSNGREVFIFPQKSRPAIHVAFLADTRILLAEAGGDAQAFNSYLPRPAAPAALPEKMLEQLGAAAGAPAFAVAHVAALPRTARNGPLRNLADMQSSMEWLVLAAQPEGDRLRILAQVQTSSVFKAMQLGVLLDGAKMIAAAALRNEQNKSKLTPEEQEALLQVLDNTHTTREGSRLQARIELTQDSLKRLVEREQHERRKERSVGR